MSTSEARTRLVLAAVDAPRLDRCGFYFAGGARIALAHGGFRISFDVDFLCASAPGYAELRQAVRAEGLRAIFSEGGLASLGTPREPRIDQYGIRFPVVVDGTQLRVEMSREGRIALGPPERVEWTQAPCLSLVDCFAEKLLANSDRWPDRDTLARDVIDLAVLRGQHGRIPEAAWRAAEGAYGSAPREDLRKAIAAFRADERFRERCFAGLQIRDPDPVLAGVELLHGDLEG